MHRLTAGWHPPSAGEVTMPFEDLPPDVRRLIEQALMESLNQKFVEAAGPVAAEGILRRGNGAFQRGDFPSALNDAQEVITMLTAPGANRDTRLLAGAFNLAAENQRNLGRYDDALANYDTAWDYAQSTSDAELKSAVLSNRGILLMKLKRFDDAIESQELALRIDIEHNTPESTGFSRHNLAATLLNAGRPAEAMPHAVAAVEIRRSIDDADELLNSCALQGEIFRKLGQYDRAIEVLRTAIELQPRLRQPAAVRYPMRVLAETLNEAGRGEEAIPLWEQIIDHVESMRTSVNDLGRLQEFDERYNDHYAEAIQANLNAGRYGTASPLIQRTRARGLKEAYTSRRVASLLRESTDAEVSAEDIREVLEPRELLVDYWLYRGKVHAFAYTRDEGPVVVKIDDPVGDFFEALRALIEPGEIRHAGAAALNAQIVRPIERFRDSVDRIYLVPHGMQMYLPFAALRRKGGRQYLVERYEVVILPAAALLPIFRRTPRVESSDCLVIGDPDGSLDHAREEAREVARLLDTEPLIGAAASADRVLDLLDGTRFDVVHFACHFTSTSRAADSGLVMANGDLITMADIASIEFHANIVSTASCMSGMVGFSAWNEFDSLTRALLLSGANAVLSAIGLLEDQAARRAMRRIYGGYVRGETLSRALAEAQRELIGTPSTAEPRYWAPLYVTGKAA